MTLTDVCCDVSELCRSLSEKQREKKEQNLGKQNLDTLQYVLEE